MYAWNIDRTPNSLCSNQGMSSILSSLFLVWNLKVYFKSSTMLSFKTINTWWKSTINSTIYVMQNAKGNTNSHFTCYIAGKTSASVLQPSQKEPWNEAHTPYGGDGTSLQQSNQHHTSLPDKKVEKLHLTLFSHFLHQFSSFHLLQDHPHHQPRS